MAAPEPRQFAWEKLHGWSGFVLVDAQINQPVMCIYDDTRGRWIAEFWSGKPPSDPPTFAFLYDAKTYCEVTAKLML